MSRSSTQSYLSLTLLTLLLVGGAKTATYYIIPEENNINPCPFSCCLTVSELISNSSSYTAVNNLTLIFLPGNHTLDSQLAISNISLLEIASNDTATARIMCNFSSGFEFHHVDTIAMSGLNFYGCGGNSITFANNFTLWNSTFKGIGGTGTALVLKDTATAIIYQCSFLSNTQGSKQLFVDFNIPVVQNLEEDIFSQNVTGANVGGAILSSNSSIFIELCVFSGNEANYGGAIFAESNSIIEMENSEFHCNRALGLPSLSSLDSDSGGSGGGGALFLVDSHVNIVNCIFFNNTLAAIPGYHGKGGVVLAFSSEMSITHSIFSDNGVTESGHGIGGVFYLYHSNIHSLSNSTFKKNSAQSSGVIHLHTSNVSANQSVFSDNMAHNRAGVISTNNSSCVQLENCSFENNRAKTLCGVISLSSSTAVLEQVVFFQ